MAASVRIKVPKFDSVNKPYSTYIQEIGFWKVVSKVDKKEQAVLLAYDLPENDPSGIRDKLFNEVAITELNSDEGMDKFITYMDKLFKKDDQTQAYDDYVAFDSYRRTESQKITDFINEFDKLYNVAAKRQMTLPQAVLAFKLLDAARLSKQDRMFVLTGVDYESKETLYDQTKTALKKFAGVQTSSKGDSSTCDIKLEPTFTAKQLQEATPEVTEALAGMGFYQKNRGRFGGRGNGYGGRGNGFGGRGRGRGRDRGSYSNRGTKGKVEKPINPKNEWGELFRCVSCGSFRHMLEKCPQSYENLEKKSVSSTFIASDDAERLILYAGYGKYGDEEICLLAVEAMNRGVLDSGCCSTVAGSEWIKTFLQTLDGKDQAEVSWRRGEKWFKFGAGKAMQSIGIVTFPCKLGGKGVYISSDIVNSDIPLLISKDTMKKAGVVLDLVNDRVKFFGQWMACDISSSGHYTVDLGKGEVTNGDVELALAVAEGNEASKGVLLKLHRQLGHPPEARFIRFLKGAGKWEDSYSPVVKDLYNKCHTCKVFAKAPPRPVCSLPAASEFGEVLTMDLKECNLPNCKYILHMIDAFTRFSVSTFVNRKLSHLIVQKVLSQWVAIFGVPKRIWTDLGGEFNNSDMKEMGDMLGVELGSGAGLAPWMNGLCERNHQIIDICLEKILYEHPKMNLEVALAWATSAKNTLQMNNGFSSHQLVFGRNPQLPAVHTDKLPALEGVTTSETVAEHIAALYSARRAFLESESSERIRRALRHKIRSVERIYELGDKVYFKRDGYNRWHGPVEVIGRTGSVYVLKHQSGIIRVAACRIQPVEGYEDRVQQDSTVGAGVPGQNSEEAVTKEKVEINLLPEGERVVEEEVQDAEGGGEERGSREVVSGGVKEVPKVKDVIRYRESEGEKWKEAVVLSRAGKQSVKSNNSNKFCVNVVPSEGGEASCVNLRNVLDWRNLSKENVEVVNLVEIPKKRHGEQGCVLAKQKELANFEEFNVYEEVKDIGQQRISCTWILSEKKQNGSKIIKARLVARGYEESVDNPSDSPTCGKDSFRIFLCVAASYGWVLESTDIKSAFLQGLPLVRDVFVEPPVEAKNPGYLWRLQKCMYGLNDAPRSWFLNVVAVLKDLGCTQMKLDLALFVYRPGDVVLGVVIVHVDDFMHIGTRKFYEDIILKLRSHFKVGVTAKGTFMYIGLQVSQGNEGIVLSQDDYIQKLEPIGISSSRKVQKHEPLNDTEKKQYRRTVGQINWAARQTRPDLIFEVMELSMKFNSALVQDMLRANKAVKKLQFSAVGITFPNLGDMKGWRMVAMSDAAFSNLADGVSSAGGYVIFLVGERGNSAPICWKANKIKRVVRSTLAAEALALEEAIEHSLYMRKLLGEMFGLSKPVPIEVWTDSNNTYAAVHTSTQIDDRRLRIDVASIKENMANEGIVVKWCKGNKMLADCLTKQGASCEQLMNVIAMGTLRDHLEECMD